MRAIHRRSLILIAIFLIALLFTNQTTALPSTDYTIIVTLDEAWSKTNADGAGNDDMYWRVHMKPLYGSGGPVICGNEDYAKDGQVHIKPNWSCKLGVSGNQNVEAEITIQMWESDGWFTGGDDHMDIHPDADKTDLELIYKPYNNLLSIDGIKGWEEPGRCSMGQILQEGKDGDDQAIVKFTVSSNLYGGATADADGDGLLNSWELCGINTDNDNDIEIDLPAMGADPLHKDLFVEVDWMVDDNGGANDHSHEPWLPSLMNAWHEMDQAHATNPDGRSGISLHLDVGNLYEDYALDFDGDGVDEIAVSANGADLDGDGIAESLYMDSDAIPDIGFLSKLGSGSSGGGNRLPGNEDTVLNPHPTNGLCGTGSDLLTHRAANFHPDRQDSFRWALFGHQHSTNQTRSSGVACWGGETFAITLGTWAREAAHMTGPSGLPVDGQVTQHTGTFLHELGHTLSIGHGGKDSVNYKPNYLGIMSYSFQMTGISYSFDNDLLADTIIGQDFDHDGQDDRRRFIYSQQKLPTLDENNLDETVGIGDSTMLTRFGPGALDTDGDGVCDRHCAFPWQWGLGDQPIDFSRGDDDGDGTADNDTKVSQLTAPPNPASTAIDLNSDLSANRLEGSNDSDQLQDGSLAVGGKSPGSSPGSSGGSDHPEVTVPQFEFLELNTSGVTPMSDEAFVARRCQDADLHKINFENLPEGTSVTTQYAPLATFSSGGGTPLIAGSTYRGGRPTQSPTRSLVNHSPGATPGALRISFGEPQRIVAFYLGRGEPAGTTYDYAQLTAYDLDGEIIGRVTRELPPVNEGITAFLGAGAVFEDRLIARVEIQNLGGATFEAPHIDDLVLCQDKKEDARPNFPEAPQFGERPVTVQVQAELLTVGPPSAEHAEPLVHTPLTHVPVNHDGSVDLTNFTFTRYEGDAISLSAPPTFDLAGTPLHFVHWIMDDHVFFPDDQTAIAMTLERDAVLTAVYATERIDCLFTVDDTSDANDLTLEDGTCFTGRSCTLRAAIEEANHQTGACIIILPAGDYVLDTAGLGEDQAATGDLDILDDLAILGAGPRKSVVNGGRLDTVFDIHNASAAMLGLTVYNGGLAGYPGGIDNAGDLSLGNCTVSNNGSELWLGGAIHNMGKLSIVDCELAYNKAYSGGAVFNSGELTVLRSLIHHNEALKQDGGGIANYLDGVTTVQQTAVLFNTAIRHGGGLWNRDEMTVTDSTISENTAGSGGGIANEGTTRLYNVTVAANHAPTSVGAGLLNISGTVSAANSLFAANLSEGDGEPDCAGVLQTAGYNLIENPTGCFVQGSAAGDLLAVPAKIGPLNYVGDKKTAGHQLLDVSPARDRGNPAAPGSGSPACALLDQIGIPRPQNDRCDIGALEMPAAGKPKKPYVPPVKPPTGKIFSLYLPTIRQ